MPEGRIERIIKQRMRDAERLEDVKQLTRYRRLLAYYRSLVDDELRDPSGVSLAPSTRPELRPEMLALAKRANFFVGGMDRAVRVNTLVNPTRATTVDLPGWWEFNHDLKPTEHHYLFQPLQAILTHNRLLDRFPSQLSGYKRRGRILQLPTLGHLQDILSRIKPANSLDIDGIALKGTLLLREIVRPHEPSE